MSRYRSITDRRATDRQSVIADRMTVPHLGANGRFYFRRTDHSHIDLRAPSDRRSLEPRKRHGTAASSTDTNILNRNRGRGFADATGHRNDGSRQGVRGFTCPPGAVVDRRRNFWPPRAQRRGKTTFINTLVGLVRKTSGTAEVFGYDVETEYQQARDAIGLAPKSSTSTAFPHSRGVDAQGRLPRDF